MVPRHVASTPERQGPGPMGRLGPLMVAKTNREETLNPKPYIE